MKANHPTSEAYEHAAWMLDCEPRALRAIAAVEAGPHGAFLSTGEPVVLFERHIFHRLTGGEYAGAMVEGTTAEWALLSASTPGGYGPVSVQHKRLAAAVELDRPAALKACSWGAFQILGLNHIAAGFPSLQAFVNAAYRSVDEHLRMLVMFIRHDDRLIEALREKDWQVFKVLYNGPAPNDYAARMAAAYESGHA